ncbi:hypothetical protein EYC95_29015 [Pseudomonas sp. BGI-2]|nr:hypothetical protein EYC95_29015 [Pseudomonas sp. BGI-2]
MPCFCFCRSQACRRRRTQGRLRRQAWLLQVPVSIRRFHRREHEAFVIKLNALRPNAACLAGCRTFADFAKNRYRTQSFT